MENVNSMRPPVVQPQSSQTSQRKRSRTPTVSPLKPPLHFDIDNSYSPIEIGSTSQEQSLKPSYEAWTDGAKAHLYQWLELPGNYEKWKCTGVKSSNGSTKSSGLTKKAITKLISEYLDTLQTKKTPEQVMSKMRYVEKKFKEAEDFLQNTGEGLTSFDEKMGITKIREKVLSICPFYYQVKPFMSESVAVNPPYIGETGMNENIEEMLFGTSTVQGFYESMCEDGVNEHFPDNSTSAEDEPDYEAEVSAQQEPNLQTPTQGTSPVPEGRQSKSTSIQQVNQKKKKPKSFQESVQDIQEENRILMEKKLDMQLPNQNHKMSIEEKKLEVEDKKLQLKDEAEKKYVLESRRLDLEFKKMDEHRQQQRQEWKQHCEEREQARQESRNRGLALQLEIEKLRHNL